MTQEISVAWNRQPWESDKSFSYFHDFYLLVDPKDRSLTEAYRRYRKYKGYQQTDARDAPGTWHNWFSGANSYGKKPPGSVHELALSWFERARAFDVHIEAEKENIWRERRLKLREDEWDFGEKLKDRARRMLAAVLFERTQDGPNGTLVTVKPTVWFEGDIGRTMDMALKFQRRAAEMDMGKLAIEHDWKKQLTDMGVDPEEFFEGLVDKIATGMAEGADA